MTDLPIFAAPRRVAPLSGLPLQRERLHEAAEAMADNQLLPVLISLIRARRFDKAVLAKLGAYDGR